MRLGLEPWVSIVITLTMSVLMMGLMERYVREQARLRSVEESAEVPLPATAGARAGRGLVISMAAVAGALTVLLLLQVSFALLGAAAVGGVALIAATLWRGSSGARRLASGEKSGAPALPESEQGER
ncbi:hypothetical protein SAMN02745121_08453 [Nannocystis exedens]|uniref:Uncharacterized protein n=1 Tax=Nannocystis exedens TaxID=54 RepID=A0A1I2I5M9_9BACT|nr:hypothetical protein [Nannocystis exedens]PCC73567.1 hypothetical protein NAEX_06655 [Nannocystis exedens]SFF37484.1 hypothetical protein SAMN02745121_08453 [Nannocystis exedens]